MSRLPLIISSISECTRPTLAPFPSSDSRWAMKKHSILASLRACAYLSVGTRAANQTYTYSTSHVFARNDHVEHASMRTESFPPRPPLNINDLPLHVPENERPAKLSTPSMPSKGARNLHAFNGFVLESAVFSPHYATGRDTLPFLCMKPPP